MKDSPNENIAELLDSWENNGYVILKGFFSHQAIDSVNDLVNTLWQNRHSLAAPITVDVSLESSSQRRMLLREAGDNMRQTPYKINDLYLEYDIIRKVVLDARLCDIIERLFGGTPLLCNSLNFEYGSQQSDHVDSFYMPSRVANGMLASWIALEDVKHNNGPVHYFAGSHKIPPYLFSHGKTNAIASEMPACRDYLESEVSKRGLTPTCFLAEKGDVLIWHSQLLHGGSPIEEPRQTRKSLVSHYFRRKDYLHHLWRIRRFHANGYYYNRRHQAVT